MPRIGLADLKGRRGYVNKDTVAEGYGSRFIGHSVTTRLEKNVRRVLQNLPSIQIGYLAAIFAAAGHEVLVTRDDDPVTGDVALVLKSLVDYRHECEWAEGARARGLKVGFFGPVATHLPELFSGSGDFVIVGEPETAANKIAGGEEPRGRMVSSALEDLNSIPFLRWDIVKKVARRHIPNVHKRQIIKTCWKLGIATTAFYVIGFLQDIEESIGALIRFAVDLDFTYANFKILIPYPGRSQFKQLEPLTQRRARLMLGMCYSRSFSDRPTFSIFSVCTSMPITH